MVAITTVAPGEFGLFQGVWSILSTSQPYSSPTSGVFGVLELRDNKCDNMMAAVKHQSPKSL